MSAYSGTLKTNAYKGRYLLFSWWLNGQNVADNTSTIYWELTGAGESTEGVNYYKAGSFSVVLNGTTVYSSDARINLYNGTRIDYGYFNIQHDSSHSENIGFLDAYVEGAIYQSAVNCSGTSYWEMPDLPRMAQITSAEAFTDEEDLTFTYYNGAGDRLSGMEVRFVLGNATVTRAVPRADNSFTITFNNTERQSLRANCTQSKTAQGTLYLESFLNDGQSNTDSWSVNFTVVNAEPTLTATIVDTNSTTKALTGDANKMIRGHNLLSYSQSAQAKKGASIVEYSVRYGGTTLNSSSGTISNAEVNVFTFSIKDSRGYIATKEITMPMVEYIKPTVNQKIDIELSEGTSAEVNLTLKGNYFNSSFGSTSNTIKLEVKYSTDGESGSWITLPTPTFSGNTYELSTIIDGLDYDSAYTFQSRITDKLGNAYSAEYVAKLVPLFDWSKDDFNFNVPVNFNSGINVNGSALGGTTILSDTITDGTVTLNDSISNYSYIEILFTDNNGRGCGVAKFIPPVADNSKTIDLFLVEASSNIKTYIRRTAYICKGTTLTPNVSTANYAQIWNSGASSNSSDAGTNYIKVVRVLGYK